MTVFSTNVAAIKKIHKQATDWEKIFAKHLPDKGRLSRVCKEFLKFNNRRQLIQFLKDKSITSKKEDIRIDNKNMETVNDLFIDSTNIH